MPGTRVPNAIHARSQTVERAVRILARFTNEEPTLGLPALAANGRDESQAEPMSSSTIS
jgi:hypothetical protein